MKPPKAEEKEIQIFIRVLAGIFMFAWAVLIAKNLLEII